MHQMAPVCLLRSGSQLEIQFFFFYYNPTVCCSWDIFGSAATTHTWIGPVEPCVGIIMPMGLSHRIIHTAQVQTSLGVPKEYHDLREVFGKAKAISLPLHWPPT